MVTLYNCSLALYSTQLFIAISIHYIHSSSIRLLESPMKGLQFFVDFKTNCSGELSGGKKGMIGQLEPILDHYVRTCPER